jgi:hypothetical protein
MMDLIRHIPDIVFLMLGIACLMVLLSIKSDLRRITKKRRRRANSWSFEDQLKHRVKYLRHCRHFEVYINNHKQKPLILLTGDKTSIIKNAIN